MGLATVTVFFLVLAVGWILLPLLPAFVELRTRSDAEPLRVVRRSDVDVRHFALGFRDFLQSHFSEQLAECAATGVPIRGELIDGTPYRVLPENALTEPEGADAATGSRPAEDPNLTISCGNLNTADDTTYPREIYSRGSLHVGDGTALRAALAEQSVYLGAGCTTFRWLHAGAEIHAGADCRLYGRVSADRLIKLDDRCRFERLHAPRIEFGRTGTVERERTAAALIDLARHPRLLDHAAGRFLFRSRLEIPAGGRVEGDVVVAGKLTIGDGAHILGNLKSHGDLELGEAVRVEGSVVSGHNLKLGDGCVLDGPVVAEYKAEVGAGCLFGTLDHPTTLSARGLKIGPGVVAHGTVWGGDS